VTDLEQRAINVIRGLAMDAPFAAKNGHPGTAMALAPLAHVLWTRIMKYDPSQPHWPDRDRFVLSNGHASILLYSMLYLTGYGLELEDIRQFRQWGSRTPGHPEVHHTEGVEVTTGPLGQGFGNSVGLALAERFLRTRFGADVCDHHTFVIAGDGCLEEGISHEAASLAGRLGLGRLVCVYDDNHISIDGPTELALNDDPAGRFTAYGWHVEDLGEAANDLDGLEAALRRAMAVDDRPSLLILRSHIGFPSPKFQDTKEAHGDPFPAEEISVTKKILGLPDEPFWVPEDVISLYRSAAARQAGARAEWDARFAAWTGDKEAWQAAQHDGALPGWETKLPAWTTEEKPIATRVAINQALTAVADLIPGLIVGAADLTGNTGTMLKGEEPQSASAPGGRQLHYGIREHAMGAVMNGLALHHGVLPIGGTFFVFSDYMRPAVRLAALSEAKVIYFWTHDSVGLGQDGPTHQPIEQLASLRAMPQLRVIRPADPNETAHAFRIALASDGPTALILTRQAVPVLAGTSFEGVSRGAYVLREADGASVTLVGTGSEVSVCLGAADLLADRGVTARVVSFPSWDLFALQPAEYQASVFPPGIPRLAVEAGTSFGWDRWAEASVSIDHFGASAPGDQVLAHFGYTPENVAEAALTLLRS
jgi:transketolase